MKVVKVDLEDEEHARFKTWVSSTGGTMTGVLKGWIGDACRGVDLKLGKVVLGVDVESLPKVKKVKEQLSKVMTEALDKVAPKAEFLCKACGKPTSGAFLCDSCKKL